ncbi:hypothetical protein M8J76_016450 [Diaphorina citri]|nr:hypothetical protein M8J77_005658 [Diaphorina citri]KAI5709359.1 hypothetical protein M8J76_016450 [Diaphorina citri]
MRTALADHVESTERNQPNQIVLRSRNVVNSNNTIVPPTTRLHAGALTTITERRHSVTPLFSSYITPSPSPDELVIQQRGRKSLPLVWSPDIDKNKLMRSARKTPTTPLSRQSTPVAPSSPSTSLVGNLLGTKLRRTPRKRLLLDDSLDAPPPVTPSLTESSRRRSESIRRTRLAGKTRSRASLPERSLSVCSTSSSEASTDARSDVSPSTVGAVLSSRTCAGGSRAGPSSHESTRTDVNTSAGEVLSSRAKPMSLAEMADPTRTFPSPPESDVSEPEALSRSELKTQLCSLTKEQLRELLCDVLERNPTLMDEIVSGKK